jgi:hypothetical protein
MGAQAAAVMLLSLWLTSLLATAQEHKGSLRTEARRRLLEAHTGEYTPAKLQLVDTAFLSSQLAQSTGTPAQNGQSSNVPKLRGLRVAFYDRIDSSRTQAERDYIMNILMPATATVLARSMRVRNPTGKLPLSGYPDELGEPIPGAAEGVHTRSILTA